ncbi:ISXO2-like transposase domain protein [bacterium BMS3Abin03]|nr:ISXO2-like transposase domain protein [bacterium BMS3Abin03]
MRKEVRPEYKEMSWITFHKKFRREEDCYSFLYTTRWPNGFECPKCKGREFWKISTRGLYKCRMCNYQVSITSGTIFHKTRTPLMKWFMLIFRMATSKTGVSINEMKRELEIKDYKTVWTMAHKIRKAMQDRDAQYKLAGLVEIDESLFGSSTSGKRGRGAQGKSLVIVAVSMWKDKKGEEKPGFAHAFVVEDASADEIEKVLKRIGYPDKESEIIIEEIRSDGWRSYQTVAKRLDIPHSRAVLTKPEDASKVLPWVHKLISNTKAVIKGPHRGVSQKHLQSYLSEICYRFNRRFWGNEGFHRLLFACLMTETITSEQLMTK